MAVVGREQPFARRGVPPGGMSAIAQIGRQVNPNSSALSCEAEIITA
jgi:hypothetical protein